MTTTNRTEAETTYWYEVGEEPFGYLAAAREAAEQTGEPVVLVTVAVDTGGVIERRVLR